MIIFMRKKKGTKRPPLSTRLHSVSRSLLFKDVIQAITLAGVPGQMNWMPPPQAPMGCPPGLEYLTAIDQVLVQQQIELLEGTLFMYSSYLNNFIIQKFVVYT